MPTPPPFSGAQKARREFGLRLGEVRKSAGLTARALAVLCDWHESKVSRIEHGKTSPSAADVVAWAAACESGRASRLADSSSTESGKADVHSPPRPAVPRYERLSRVACIQWFSARCIHATVR